MSKKTRRIMQSDACLPIESMGGMPLIEMTGNRSVIIEGSTGILLYESERIKINTSKTAVTFSGRGLTVKCISCSCVEICGFIISVEFSC